MHGYICHASGAGATIILLLACIAADAGVSDDTQHMQEIIVLDIGDNTYMLGVLALA